MKSHALCYRIAFAAIFLPLLAENSYAFDGRRNGVIIGLGLGGAYSLVNPPDLPGTEAKQNRFGATGDFRIGFSGSRLSVFFDARTGIVGGMSDIEGLGDSSIDIGINGVGVTYYRAEEAPSLYLLGVLGQAHWSVTESSNWEFFGTPHSMAEASGFGVCVGIGWEFKRHWSIETGLLWGQVHGTYDHFTYPMEHGDIDTTVSVLHLTFNYLLY